MPKKSFAADNLIDRFKNSEIESSMIIALAEDGERIYLHQFDSEIEALEFLELMVASFRADVLENIVKRSMN